MNSKALSRRNIFDFLINSHNSHQRILLIYIIIFFLVFVLGISYVGTKLYDSKKNWEEYVFFVKERSNNDKINEDYYYFGTAIGEGDLIKISIIFNEKFHYKNKLNLIIYDTGDLNIPSNFNNIITYSSFAELNKIDLSFQVNHDSNKPTIVWRNVSENENLVIPSAKVTVQRRSVYEIRDNSIIHFIKIAIYKLFKI